jgi:hypothetical protein
VSEIMQEELNLLFLNNFMAIFNGLSKNGIIDGLGLGCKSQKPLRKLNKIM